MTRTFDFRSLLLASAFLVLGFLIGSRMTAAEAHPAAGTGDDRAPSFAGSTGCVVVDGTIIVVRDSKIWKLPLSAAASDYKPWVKLVD